MQLRFFGQLADITGKPTMEMEGIANTDELVKKLEADFPALAKCNYLISVNKKIIKQNQPLQPGDEVALLPPFSGG